MKFAQRLSLLFTLVALVSGGVIVYSVYALGMRGLEAQTRHRFEDVAFHAMDKIDLMLFERFSDVRLMAQDDLLASAAATAELRTQRLLRYRDTLKHYASIAFFTPDRLRIADTAGLGIGERHAAIGYWPEITAGRDPAVSIYHSAKAGQTLIHFAAVAKGQESAPTGVVVARLPLERLHEILRKASGNHDPEEAVRIDLVDQEGTLLYSDHDPDKILKEKGNGWEAVRQAVEMGRNMGSLRLNLDGEDHLVSFCRETGHKDYPGQGWTIILHLPAREAFAPARALRDRITAILLPLGLLALLAIYIVARRAVRPLLFLKEAAQGVGSGNLDAVVAVDSADEFGELAASFNDMASSLKTAQAELTGQADALALANRELQSEIEARKRLEADQAEMLKERTRDLSRTNRQLVAEIERRAETESRLVAALAEVREANFAAEEASRAKSEFLANMSHEIRTPLNAVIGFGEMLADELIGPLNEKQRSCLDNLQKGGRRLHDLLINILDMAQAEFGDGRLDPSIFLLRDAIIPAIDGHRHEADARGIALAFELAPEADTLISADAGKLRKVMHQLIGNALKFTPDGGRVRVCARSTDDVVEISVADTGIGIAPADLPRLFQPFTQLESPFTKRYAGTGLGLTLARRLIELHHGTIRVESEEGKGSCFAVTIPRLPPQPG